MLLPYFTEVETEDKVGRLAGQRMEQGPKAGHFPWYLAFALGWVPLGPFPGIFLQVPWIQATLRAGIF